MSAPFIIADVGANHRGILELAIKHINAAKACGCNAVKFQLYTHQELYGIPGKLDYEMPREWVETLKKSSDDVGIEFMCSAFSPEGYEFVDPFVSIHKIASSEMLDPPIVEKVKSFGKTWIASTGGAHYHEVAWLCEKYRPTVVLECVSSYPAEAYQYNLPAMKWWKLGYQVIAGISDHTRSGDVSLAASRLGAVYFERHVDILKGSNWSTPDTTVSSNPNELARYVDGVRAFWDRFAKDGKKRPEDQRDSALYYRRRPIIIKSVKAGDKLVFNENFGLYRSLKPDSHGAPAQKYQDFDGKTMNHAMEPGESIWVTDVYEEQEIREKWQLEETPLTRVSEPGGSGTLV